jgi:hypothetical protein
VGAVEFAPSLDHLSTLDHYPPISPVGDGSIPWSATVHWIASPMMSADGGNSGQGQGAVWFPLMTRNGNRISNQTALDVRLFNLKYLRLRHSVKLNASLRNGGLMWRVFRRDAGLFTQQSVVLAVNGPCGRAIPQIPSSTARKFFRE